MRLPTLRDRVILVTGASSGLGRAIALHLAQEEHADLILTARRADRLAVLAEEIAAMQRKAWTVATDLMRPEAPAELIARAVQIAGTRLFGLVNNAGVTSFGAFASMASGDIDRLVTLNLRATLELSRCFVRQMQLSPTTSVPRGALLTISSAAGFVPVPYQAVYAATKHALLGFGESIAAELRTYIAVTTFAPGGINTEMVNRSGIARVTGTRYLASPELVAARAVRAWKRGRLTATAGLENRVIRLLSRLISHRMIGRQAERIFRPPSETEETNEQ